MPRHLHRKVCRRAKTVKTEALSGFDSGQPQRTKADDSRAKQRRRLLIWEDFRNRVNKTFRRDNILCVSPILAVPGKTWVVTQILFSSPAIWTGAVHMMQPGDPHAGSHAKSPRAFSGFFDDAHDLMAWNHRRLTGCQFSFHYMQIRAAYAATTDPYENVSCRRIRSLHLHILKRIRFDRSWKVKQAGFHEVALVRAGCTLPRILSIRVRLQFCGPA